MRFDVVTLSPELFEPLDRFGVIGRALRDGRVRLKTWNLRDFASPPHWRVDDRPYGGGPGMVLMAEPLWRAVRAAREEAPAGAPVIYLSPQGRRLDQRLVEELAGHPGLILVCGRFEGVDERWVESQVDQEISVGDFVMTGGEIPALMLLDAVSRLVPGTVGDEQSLVQESFQGGVLDAPVYTRPAEWRGHGVPAVLLGGHHGDIAAWRGTQGQERTERRRPDLVAPSPGSGSDTGPLGKDGK
jgi:tRNA (guanine37-N1)-methyltransferase